MELRVEIEKRLPGFTLEAAFRAGPEPLGILGGSGSGKTLTLRSIAGLETPTRGRIELGGRVVFDSASGVHLPSRKRNVGMVFQNYALFPHLNVAENIGFGLDRFSRGEREERVRREIRAMHLEGLERRTPRELSGGQEQRVALARALAPDPQALLLDEPFSALDTYLRSRLERQLLETLRSYRGVAVLVSHNLEEVFRVCANLVVLSEGRVAAAGPKEEIFERPASLRVAELTGCKNFSKARAMEGGRVEATDWGVTLRVAQDIPGRLGHAGVRANHLRITGSSESGENTFPCWLAAVTETPFRRTLYLKLNAPADGEGDYHLQVEILKEKWESLKDCPMPWRVTLDPKRVLLLPD